MVTKIRSEITDFATPAEALQAPRKVPRLIQVATAAYVEMRTELWVPDYNVLFGPTLETAVEFWRVWPD